MPQEHTRTKKNLFTAERLWDIWCIASVIGLWPRYIEPNLLPVSRLRIPITNLPSALSGLRIIHISDLHLNKGTTKYFLHKLKRKIIEELPDLIVFTGDFLCFSQLQNKTRLKKFLNELPTAPYGNYAILGNHDYQSFVSIDANGDYAIQEQNTAESPIIKGFKRLFSKITISGKIKKGISCIPMKHELVEILQESCFQLLHNETHTLKIEGVPFNITGLGEHMMDRCKPDQAFKNYNQDGPGLILVHNPDAIPSLLDKPGHLILSGHTHGGQINLPFIWRKFVLLENMRYVKGLFEEKQKKIYITRGLGGVLNFRWFCPPELVSITLECAR